MSATAARRLAKVLAVAAALAWVLDAAVSWEWPDGTPMERW